MDCRMSLLFLLTLSFASGCVSVPSAAHTPGISDVPPPNAVVEKAKDGPKRPPLPGTVVAVAVMREREGDSTKDPGDKLKCYDDARKYYQEALKIDPKYRDAIQGLARVYCRLDDFAHAIELYHKALEKTPQDHGLWFDMGLCYNRQHDLTKSIPCFQKAMELDPENRQYMKTLGFTLVRAGQTEQGLKHLTRAMGTAMAHYNVARLMEHMQQPDQCRQHLQMALASNPNLEQAQEMLNSLNGQQNVPINK
jgi:tetratricopeptide (TPR) repeat protein